MEFRNWWYDIGTEKLTFQASLFSSYTAIYTVRVSWVTGHNAFQSFLDANIMADWNKIVITTKFKIIVIGSAIGPYILWMYLRAIFVISFVGSMGQGQLYQE